MLDGRHIRHGLRAIGTIQVVAQDRDDGAVGARADIDPALTRSLDAIGAVAAHQTEDAETGAEALLGVRFGGEDHLHQVRCGGTDPGGLASQPGWRPVGVATMCARHVVWHSRVPMPHRIADVHGNADTVMENLHCAIGDAGLHHLADQPVGHRIPMPVHLDVIVEAGPTALPFGIFEGFCRQRLQGRAFDRLEQRAPAAADPAHGAGVQFVDQLTDCGIEFAKREEPATAELGQYPSLHHQDGDFDFCLVARLAHARWHDRRAVMRRHILIGAIDPRLIAARGDDAGLEVVADDLTRKRHR